MANCDICGNKIGFLSDYTLSITSVSGYLEVKVCERCNLALDKMKRGDEESFSQIKELMKSSPNENAKKFCSAWALDSELPGAKEAREKAAQKKRAAEEKARWEEDLHNREQRANEYAEQVARLKQYGSEGYYEYKVVKLVDNVVAGCLDAEQLTNTLNQLGIAGWRLVTAYSNELGKNALALGGFGVNATADEHILIFERFQKIK